MSQEPGPGPVPPVNQPWTGTQPIPAPPGHTQALPAGPPAGMDGPPPHPGYPQAPPGPPVPQWPAPPDPARLAAAPAPHPEHPRRSTGRRLVWVAVLMLGCLLTGYAGGLLGSSNGAMISVLRGGNEPAAPPPGSVAEVAARTLPSVVLIEVSAGSRRGTGSGFVLREDGYILTNNHVVEANGANVQVVFSDGSREPATVVGRTVSYDLAVVKINRGGLKPLTFADSSRVQVGQPVIAIGAPLGLQSTVTTGIVSALHRPVGAGQGSEAAFIDAVQTDAAINPGNSGGPLVDMSGNVVGVNSAIAKVPGGDGSTGGNIGVGFAIPAEQAARTAEQLIRNGKATFPIVGVLLDQKYSGRGVKVAAAGARDKPSVTPGGPADQAGIKPDDVITAFNGRPITEPDALIVAIRAQRPGDTIKLTVQTGGNPPREVSVTLDESEDS